MTAYVGCALAETRSQEGLSAACAAWNWLIAESSLHGPGLGYCSSGPQDADSTTWGLRLAEVIGRSADEFATRAFRHLISYMQPDGGVATFAAADIQRIGLGDSPDAVVGWTGSHNCVTSTVAWLRELSRRSDLHRFLVRTQEPAGFWRAYWWADYEYATAHAIESFQRIGGQHDATEQALRWLRQNRRSASPFALALRLLGMSAAKVPEADAALQELLELQLPDGSWPSSARMQIPPPYVKNPQTQWNWDERGESIGSIIVDRKRIFTTATAVRAISAWLIE